MILRRMILRPQKAKMGRDRMAGDKMVGEMLARSTTTPSPSGLVKSRSGVGEGIQFAADGIDLNAQFDDPFGIATAGGGAVHIFVAQFDIHLFLEQFQFDRQSLTLRFQIGADAAVLLALLCFFLAEKTEDQDLPPRRRK